MDNRNNENDKLPIEKNNEPQLPEQADTSDFAFKWEYTENKKDSGKKETRFFASLFILSIIFLAAFSFFAVYTASNQKVDTNTASYDDLNDTQKNEGETKTIYIKDLSAAEGVLTPQEIYTSSINSVVSIRCSAKDKESIGTGFIYTSDGYIATVHHVIAGMDKIAVISSDGKEYEAKVIASNELCDLAILKIEASGLKSVTLGNSSALLVGEELVAIGTPASIEFAGTMTRGDVSFNDRVVYVYDETGNSLKKKMTLIQTSAVLNPGNSGGPVFDAYGKVVGIVTMKLGAGFDGIGFAIPITAAAPILDDMIKGVTPSDDKLSAVARYAAKLGIVGQSFSGDVDKKTLLGVSITEFHPSDCDAARMLRVGDVIVSINGNAVPNTASLARMLCSFDPNDTVSVTVYRSGQLLSFSVRVTK